MRCNKRWSHSWLATSINITIIRSKWQRLLWLFSRTRLRSSKKSLCQTKLIFKPKTQTKTSRMKYKKPLHLRRTLRSLSMMLMHNMFLDPRLTVTPLNTKSLRLWQKKKSKKLKKKSKNLAKKSQERSNKQCQKIMQGSTCWRTSKSVRLRIYWK